MSPKLGCDDQSALWNLQFYASHSACIHLQVSFISIFVCLCRCVHRTVWKRLVCEMDVISCCLCRSTQCEVTFGICVFNHFKNSLKQSYSSKQDSDSDKKSILSYAGQFVCDLNISECLTKELSQRLQKREPQYEKPPCVF